LWESIDFAFDCLENFLKNLLMALSSQLADMNRRQTRITNVSVFSTLNSTLRNAKTIGALDGQAI
jgi:hypothetical protein